MKTRLRVLGIERGVVYHESGEVCGEPWDAFIPLINFGYNTTPTAVHGFSPFELVFGRKAPLRTNRAMQRAVAKCQPLLTKRDAKSYLKTLKRHIREIRETAKETQRQNMDARIDRENLGRRRHGYQVDNLVVVSVKETRVGNRSKLAPYWQGPWIVEGCQSDRPSTLRCRSLMSGKVTTINASRLKRFHSTDEVRSEFIR